MSDFPLLLIVGLGLMLFTGKRKDSSEGEIRLQREQGEREDISRESSQIRAELEALHHQLENVNTDQARAQLEPLQQDLGD